MTKKSVLLLDDFARHFKYCRGALVQRLDQPVGRLHSVGHVLALAPAAGSAADPRIIAVVDEDAGQGVGVQLDNPAAVGLYAHQDIGNDWLRLRRIEGKTPARVQGLDLPDHPREAVSTDLAEAQHPRKGPRRP